MADIDEQLVDEAERAFKELNRRYWQASEAEKWDLEPQVEAALQKWLLARIRLLKEGTIANEKDLARMKEIKKAIDTAADHQTLILAATRFIGLLAQFAV